MLVHFMWDKYIYSADAVMHKAMISLFTYASTSNIHLELTRCLKRFVSRRVMVNIVVSDNFKTFVINDVKVVFMKDFE